MTWYIFRHCESLNNKLKIKYGSGNYNKEVDALLTIKGIDQAKSIGYRMLGLEEDFSKFDLIGTSLSRTRHTLQVVSEILDIDNKIIKKEDLLISKCWTNFPKPTEEEKKEKEANPWIWAPKGCIESYKREYERVLEFYEQNKNKENLIICGHQGTTSVLIKILSGWTMEQIKENRKTKEFKYNQNYFYSWNKDTGIVRH